MNLDKNIYRKLRSAWHKQRGFWYLRGLSWLLIAGVGLIFADLLLDLFLRLSPLARTVLLVLNLAVLVFLVQKVCIRYLRRFNESRVSLQVEKRHPELKSILISTVQFAQENMQPGMSKDLVALVQQQAGKQTGSVDFSTIVNFAKLKKLLISAASALLVLVGVTLLAPDYMKVLVTRLLYPPSMAIYPSQARVETCSGDQVVREGSPVWLKATAGGQIPADGTLMVSVGSGNVWEEIPVRREQEHKFSYHFSEIYQDFAYYFRIGDARSLEYKVSVIPSPRVTEASVKLLHPKYMRLPDRKAASLNLRVPEGTTLEWTLKLDRAVKHAELVRGGGDKAVASIEEGGHQIRVSTTADRSEPYHFEWTERENGYEYEGSRHFIQMIPDIPPHVEIVKPADDMKGTLRRTLNLAFAGADDHGLASARIIYQLNESQEKSIDLGALNSERSVRNPFDWALAKSMPELKVGDIVTFFIEVIDTYESEGSKPHRVRSEGRRFQVLSESEYVRYIDDLSRAQLSTLNPLYRQERESHESLSAMSEAIEEEDLP